MPKCVGRRVLDKLRGSSEAESARPLASPRAPEVDREQLLAAVGDVRTGGPTAMDHLASLLIGIDRMGDPELDALAASLLVAADPIVWKNLALATQRAWWDVPNWAKTARERVGQDESGGLALVVASFHPDGFVREAAVSRLGEIDDAVALPVLALRTGDWVPQVRERARAAVGRRVASSVQSLLGVGPVAVLLADRVQGAWLFAQLSDSITALDDDELSQLLSAPDWRLRRVGYSVALRDERLGQSDLLDAAEHDGDLVIRVQCADAAIRAAVAADAVDDVRPLTTSGTATVRAAAVSALARAGETDVAEAALADGNPIVREVAQAAVRRVGADPAARYRALVQATTPADPGAVAGLGETGAKPDVELIQPSLADARPRGRVEAVRALRRLGSVDVAMLVNMLDDPSAAVTRQVATTLVPRTDEIAAERLGELLDPRSSPHVRTAAYRLLRAQGVWTRLLTDLELYEDDDENLRSRARGDLFSWLERDAATTYSMPAGATANRFDVLLREIATSLGPKRARLLRFHLGLTDFQTSASNVRDPEGP